MRADQHPQAPETQPPAEALPMLVQLAAGLQAAVLCPIGFVCDHIEVLYDLDREAGQVCRSIGLPMTRAAAVNDDPLFVEMMAEMVLKTITRRPLPLVGSSA